LPILFKAKTSALESLNKKKVKLMSEELYTETEKKMTTATERLLSDFSKVRTGRASPSLVEGIKVDYFGTATPMKQLAQISIPDAKTIQISSWDQSAIPHIEKAIIAANLGVTPNVDGKIVRLSIPPLSEDRRKDVAKSIKKLGEDSKIAIRNARRDANDEVKKNKALSEDESKKSQKKIQDITDAKIKEVDLLVENKQKEILEI